MNPQKTQLPYTPWTFSFVLPYPPPPHLVRISQLNPFSLPTFPFLFVFLSFFFFSFISLVCSKQRSYMKGCSQAPSMHLPKANFHPPPTLESSFWGSFPATTVIWMFGLPLPWLFRALETCLACLLSEITGEALPRSFSAWNPCRVLWVPNQWMQSPWKCCGGSLQPKLLSHLRHGHVWVLKINPPPQHQCLWEANKNHSDKRIDYSRVDPEVDSLYCCPI